MLAALSAAALALVPGMPKMDRPAILQSPARLPWTAPAALVAPAVASVPLPAFADDFDIGGAVVNLGLTVIVFGFVAYIGKFVLEAMGEVGNSAGTVAKFLSSGGDDGKVSNEPVYDDSGTGQNDQPITKRSKKRLVTDEEIARMAPWMAAKIDQDAIEKAKEARKKRKAGK